MNKNNIEILSWDSKIFDVKIGRYYHTINNDPRLLNLELEHARSEKYELIYVMSDDPLPSDICNFYNGKKVSTKIDFALSITKQGLKLPHQIMLYDRQINISKDQLYSLAYQSGHLSRFKIDQNFSELQFEKLYRTWIEKSINLEIADAVFIYKERNSVFGVITVKINGNKGIIGLLSVDECKRKLGIGSLLLESAMYFLLQNGVGNIEVATQGENVKACNFYKSKDFIMKKKTHIYHFWM